MTEMTTDAGQADGVKERVQETAQQVKGQARDRATEQIDNRTTQAGEQLRDAVTTLRRSSDDLRSEGKGGPANLVSQVADRGERLADYLSNANADRLLRDVEDFARRQPWLFAGATAVAGFLGSRFLKASSSRRYEAAGGYEPAVPPPPAPPVPYDVPPAGVVATTRPEAFGAPTGVEAGVPGAGLY